MRANHLTASYFDEIRQETENIIKFSSPLKALEEVSCLTDVSENVQKIKYKFIIILIKEEKCWDKQIFK